ncbi:MAG: pilus assembly protein N-terminal domain-containing protein [Pirellulales bacterium]|nr:pilus assembly protein N-terminal domain-containing protein [Pirellulales bacterium]
MAYKIFIGSTASLLVAMVSLLPAQTYYVANVPASDQTTAKTPAQPAQGIKPQTPVLSTSTSMAEVPGIVFKLQAQNERLKMTVNTSRIVTLDKQMPQVQVNNPEILQLTILSPHQVQLAAKKAGVTQVNIWDEKNQIYTIDVIVFGDARELQEMLASQFPNTSLRVTPVANSVVISGFVDKPQLVPHVIRIAEEYYPKVINNIIVGGVHQVLLQCKVMEVSRTKMREIGFDFSKLTGNNIVQSGISGVVGISDDSLTVINQDQTFFFRLLDGSNGFLGVLKALREDKLVKVLAEPTLMCYSGRPAAFLVGGKIPYPVASATGTPGTGWMKFGTKLNFVPIVLGNGRIRLEVRPEVSEIDRSISTDIGGFEVPGLKERSVETGVELDAGQTLAIAGLLQTRMDAIRRGLPWVSEVPYIGALFGSNQNQENEVELLVLVTPELVDAMNPDEVPTCLPGTRTDVPEDCELYLKRYIEVPRCCPPGSAGTCPECNQGSEGQMPGMILKPTPVETIDQSGTSGQQGGLLLKPTTHKTPYLTPGAGNMPGPRNMVSQPHTAYRSVQPSNRYIQSNRNSVATPGPNNMPGADGDQKTLPGFIGPVGYDVVK